MNAPGPRVRVAVVGAGSWGAQHTRAFGARDDVEVVGVFSRNGDRAAQRASSVGARGYDDLDALLRAERPDLISVCLPNTEHFAVTRYLLDRGQALLVEKPLVFDVDEGRELVARARARGLFFAVNFNHRYAVPVVKAREALESLGELSFATWRFGGEGGAGSGPDGNLIETQCHGFDLLEHLAGPIDAVSAEMTQRPDPDGRPHHGTVSIALHFASGAVGSLLGSYDSSYAYPASHRLELDGRGGRVVVTDTVQRFELSRPGEETRQVWEAGYFADNARSFEATVDAHLAELVPAFAAGAAPPVPAAAALRALELAHAAIRSFREGRRVSV